MVKSLMNLFIEFLLGDLSSSGYSDKNGECENDKCKRRETKTPGSLKEYKEKSDDHYEKIKGQLQKSTFALRKLISYADKIYGWGFDAHSMNDCKEFCKGKRSNFFSGHEL